MTTREKCRWCGNPLEIPEDRYCSARCEHASIVNYLFNERFESRLSGEKWPRFCAEIPPELATILDEAQRKSLGVNTSARSRASMVRAGLQMYLEAISPAPEPAINTTAEEIVEVPALETGR